MTEFFTGVMDTYANFFSWSELVAELTDPANLGIILSLIVLEGILSADNALVLAAMVKGLPEKQRKKALMYGIWGAYLFRFIAIGLGVYLVQFSWVKILGGGYLLYLAFKFFWDRHQASKNPSEDEEGEQVVTKTGIVYRIFGQFWGTVFMVEVMDVAFSIDSVLAAFAVSDQVWVLFIGGLLGVLMMRGVAGIFLKLLEAIPELEASAFIIIIFVGLKMFLSGFGIHMLGTNETVSNVVFFSVLIGIFAFTIIRHKVIAKKQKA